MLDAETKMVLVMKKHPKVDHVSLWFIPKDSSRWNFLFIPPEKVPYLLAILENYKGGPLVLDGTDHWGWEKSATFPVSFALMLTGKVAEIRKWWRGKNRVELDFTQVED